MDKLIKKFYEVEIKQAEDDERSFWFTASTEDRDRDGDVIIQNGWKFTNYKKNPAILWGHNYLSTPIGKALDFKIQDEKLKVKIQFVPPEIDPFAEKVYQLVKNGFLKTVSVGFIPYKTEPLTEEDKKKNPDLQYGRRMWAELLEISLVPIPSNPMALRERNFQEVMAKLYAPSQSSELPEKKSDKLNYCAGQEGEVDTKRVRACAAALLGARGGVNLPDKEAHYRHIKRVADLNKINIPEFKDGMNQAELKEEFYDVWHEELLEILFHGEEDGMPDPNLIKGKNRDVLKGARDLLNAILEIKTDSPEDEIEKGDMVVSVGKLTKQIEAVIGQLK